MFFDIGANIGDYSKMLENKSLIHDLYVEIHLFEPTQSCFEVLENKFHGENITLNNFGASNSNDVATIFYDKEKSGLASLYQRNLKSYGLKLDRSEDCSGTVKLAT